MIQNETKTPDPLMRNTGRKWTDIDFRNIIHLIARGVAVTGLVAKPTAKLTDWIKHRSGLSQDYSAGVTNAWFPRVLEQEISRTFLGIFLNFQNFFPGIPGFFQNLRSCKSGLRFGTVQWLLIDLKKIIVRTAQTYLDIQLHV